MPGLLKSYDPTAHDVTLTCSYPFTNWALRRPILKGSRPPHVFVTQNGDWPAISKSSEYRFFGCEGLVCTNPQYYERNKSHWRCCLIPNGVDCTRFFPGPGQREKFGIPLDRAVVLMVSALIESKRISDGIRAVAKIPDAYLVVAGDGPLRQQVDAEAASALPDRFTRLRVNPDEMPSLYRSSNVFLHLSKNELSPLSFVEALASGLPVVAHQQPQLHYIVGDDEFLTDTSDIGAVANQILLALREGPAQAQTRSAKAASFAWPKIAEKYRQFLHEVINS